MANNSSNNCNHSVMNNVKKKVKSNSELSKHVEDFIAYPSPWYELHPRRIRQDFLCEKNQAFSLLLVPD